MKIKMYWAIFRCYWDERTAKDCRQKTNRIMRKISRIRKEYTNEQA